MVAIPLTTLAVGSHPFGPLSTHNNTQASLVIDRTVAGGLDATPAAAVDIVVAGNGGWAVSVHIPGGPQMSFKDDNGNLVRATVADLNVTFPTSVTSVSGTVTVSGAPVTVQGSFSAS